MAALYLTEGNFSIAVFRNLWPYSNIYTKKDYKYAQDNDLNWIGEDGANVETVLDYIENKAKDISNEEVEYIIENIGEPFVKRKLQRDLYYKRLAGQHNDKN